MEADTSSSSSCEVSASTNASLSAAFPSSALLTFSSLITSHYLSPPAWSFPSPFPSPPPHPPCPDLSRYLKSPDAEHDALIQTYLLRAELPPGALRDIKLLYLAFEGVPGWISVRAATNQDRRL
jgi:hypothetical protein